MPIHHSRDEDTAGKVRRNSLKEGVKAPSSLNPPVTAVPKIIPNSSSAPIEIPDGVAQKWMAAIARSTSDLIRQPPLSQD